MHRVSTSFSLVSLTLAMAGLLLLPRGIEPAPANAALHKADFSASRIDPMPVGTARQIARSKQIRAGRKA
jgi:hypothetical protein